MSQTLQKAPAPAPPSAGKASGLLLPGNYRQFRLKQTLIRHLGFFSDLWEDTRGAVPGSGGRGRSGKEGAQMASDGRAGPQSATAQDAPASANLAPATGVRPEPGEKLPLWGPPGARGKFAR